MKKLIKLSMLFSSAVWGAMTATSAIAQGACNVSYQPETNWGSGAQYKVTLTNTSAAKTNWELCWSFPGSETVSSMWEATYSQTGKNVCAKNVGYNGNLATNGSIAFGLIVSNPGAAIPDTFTLNGVACGDSASSASSVASSIRSSSSSSAAGTAARWLLDASQSTFHFVSVKKASSGTETPENFTFSQLQGTVSTSGQATLTIPLTSISTNNVVRDPRMQSLLFEAGYLPSLHFTTQLDLPALDAMPAGTTRVQTVSGNLVLHGIVKSIVFDAMVIKHANNSVSFSPRKPIIINSVDFDLNAGVEALRAIAGLSTIGERVPVYFKIFLNRDNPTNLPAINLATAPSAPVNLTGTVGSTGTASLNWADVSATESGFLVRRKGADGRWATATNAPANSVSYQDALTAAGSYDYKVIGYTDSVPAAATAPLTLVYETSTLSSSSASSVGSVASSSASSFSSRSSGSSSSTGVLVGDVTRGANLWNQKTCVGCHGVDGVKFADGSFAIPVNPNRSSYSQVKGENLSLRDYITKYMPQGDAATCTGQCAADLEAYIFTWRRPADGIPDKPATAFSCPSTATAPGQRTLRLLTRAEYQRSVGDLVNYQEDVISRLPDDAISGSFLNNNSLLVDTARYSSYLSTAERIADSVATRWNSVLACTPTNACADKLVSDLAPRIFRRPLTTTEQSSYQALARGTTGGRTVTEGMKVALATMLSAPQFLYRSEIGDAAGGNLFKLNGYEMATYLSYTFTGTTPDAALMAAAARGDLNTVAGIRTQTSTLLNSANTKVLMGDFINRWVGTEKLATQNKVGVANFATLAGDMQKELGKNFAAAVLDSTASFATIYNPNFTYVNQRLATHYGLAYSSSGADADGFIRATTSERGGVLTSGAFMSRYARDNDANLITRAVAVRRKLMCQDIPEPPSGVSLDREALFAQDREFYEDPHTTQRMIFDRITGGTTCSNCHAEIINPLGGGLENFDTAGRIRSTDLKGNAIVSSGTFYSPYPQLQFLNDPDRVLYSPEIKFNGAKDLARTIVEHPELSSLAQTCLATQFVSYSSGINSIFLIDSDRDVGYKRISPDEENAYRCDVADLTNVLSTKGPRAMLEEIPALESVMYRKEWVR
jgi:polyisoprenoid-binding protein YceI/mono/diheme cytochrome c family protein